VIQRLALVLLLLFAVGCAHRLPPETSPWQNRQAQLEAIHQWQLKGKLGVRVPGDNGSANLHWQQIDESFALDLAGPLGSKRVRIEGRPGEVSLQESGGQVRRAGSAEQLLLQSLGWTLPLSHLGYWVRGLPAPEIDIDNLQHNETNQPSLLEQAGWRIHYSNYQNFVHARGQVALPGKILAEYTHEDIRLTLVIRDWQLGPAQ
jgi:outer membrane lipoprotein LolB